MFHIQLRLLSVLICGPLIVLLCLICITNILVHAIALSQFSQDNVSSTRMNTLSF